MRTSTLSLSKITHNKIFRSAAAAAFWLAVWWAAAAYVDKELLIPTPLAVAKSLAQLAVTADFWLAALYSLLRIFLGALAGVILGASLAAATTRFDIADMIFSPAMRVVRTVPVASFIILVLLWVKKSYVPAVISCLMVLPVMWESVCAGIRSADPQLLEMSRAYRMSKVRVIRYIYLPAVKPRFSAGIRTCIGLAWKSGVAAEVLCLPKLAVGTQVYYSKIYLETPALFAWTITVIVLSLLLEKAVARMLTSSR